MQLFPAIDLKGGQVVRLTQGDYDRVAVYSSAPAEIARQFEEKGAKNLHVVDLDGARDGKIVNYEAIAAIRAAGKLFIEIGGGIRDEDRIRQYLELGMDRVILGTVAVENFAFLEEMVARYGKQIAVGVDARDGRIAVKGWREVTGVDSLDFCKRLDAAGVSTIIYTDIARDGAMEGANLEVYRVLGELVSCDIMASGGVSAEEDLVALRKMDLYGAIVGKALYNGALDLERLVALC